MPGLSICHQRELHTIADHQRQTVLVSIGPDQPKAILVIGVDIQAINPLPA